MGKVEKLIEILKKDRRTFFHFTDVRNLPSIRENGLLPMRSLKERKVIIAPGGNAWSFDADQRSGMDGFVHLCFFDEHPMQYLATKEGRIGETRFLKISPEVLLTEGTLITNMVANHADALPKTAEEMIAELDLKVIYTRTDWKDPKIQARLKVAKKYEILVPRSVPTKFIRGLN